MTMTSEEWRGAYVKKLREPILSSDEIYYWHNSEISNQKNLKALEESCGNSSTKLLGSLISIVPNIAKKCLAGFRSRHKLKASKISVGGLSCSSTGTQLEKRLTQNIGFSRERASQKKSDIFKGHFCTVNQAAERKSLDPDSGR